MLLAVDVGNTSTKVGMFAGQRLVQRWRIRSLPGATADEWERTLRGLLAGADLRDARWRAAVLAAVVPGLQSAWAEALARVAPRVLVLGPEVDVGLQLQLAEPGSLGPDRLADALAAWRLYGEPVLAVDLGTATTVTAVGRGGRLLGGVIAPGVATAAQALFDRAARLRPVPLTSPARVLGQGTAVQLQAGILWGAAGQLDALVSRVRQELGEPARVVATGGWAEAIVPLTSTVTLTDPDLTLHGLRLAHAAAGR